MKLTEEQKNVIKAFMKFLIDPKEKFMIINGPAGSGKTTMIKAMLEAMDKEFKLLKTLLCENQDESFNIKLTATTNKAVRRVSGIQCPAVPFNFINLFVFLFSLFCWIFHN